MSTHGTSTSLAINHFSFLESLMSDFFETEAQESEDEENVAASVDSSKFLKINCCWKK